jgi:hypothetical protein
MLLLIRRCCLTTSFCFEDYVGMRWDQGGSFRLASCEAIWNGTDMEIQYDPLKNCCEIMG